MPAQTVLGHASQATSEVAGLFLHFLQIFLLIFAQIGAAESPVRRQHEVKIR